MSNSNNNNKTNISDNFEIIANLIIADIEIHNLMFWLSDTSVQHPPIDLKIHRTIFKLIGFESKDINEELDDWYYKQIEDRILIDTQSSVIMSNKIKRLINALHKKRIELSPMNFKKNRNE